MKCLLHDQGSVDAEEDTFSPDDPWGVDLIIVRESFPPGLSFKDFSLADQNVVVGDDHEFAECDQSSADCSGLEMAEEEREDEDLVTDDEALQALATLFNHCSQRAKIIPDAGEALRKYRDVVILDFLRKKGRTDTRSFFRTAK